MTRSANVSHYKWAVYGKLDNIPIDQKFCSLQEFVKEYGKRTPLKLDRYKVKRFREGQKHHLWNLNIVAIKEKRKKAVVYFD